MIDTAGGSTSVPGVEAAIPASTSPTAVNLACPCPGHPHDFDTVFLFDHAPGDLGTAAMAVMRRITAGRTPENTPPELEKRLDLEMEVELRAVYLRYGIKAWTFMDENGPVPCIRPIYPDVLEELLPFGHGGYEVSEATNDLYTQDVMRPFAEKLRTRSPDGAAENSTSATIGSLPTPLRPSKRSSPSSSGHGKRSGR